MSNKQYRRSDMKHSHSQETLYFAYGSNMDLTQMKYRCRTAELFCNGKLDDHKLVERLHADIEVSEGAEVHGILMFIQPDDLKSLDIYEGYPSYYDRKFVDVETEHGTFQAIAYEMTEQCKNRRDFQPYSSQYRKLCSDASRYHNLPLNHFEPSFELV